MIKKIIHLCLLLFLFINYANAQKKSWSDSVFSKLSLDEKIGQLFMVPAYSYNENLTRTEIDELIKKYHIGGVLFFQGNVQNQVKLTNRYQQISKIPLLIGIDAEWGLSMRLDSTIKYPKQSTLAAIKNNELLYKLGNTIANECKRIGVHINFSPVVDVNYNMLNSTIGIRSFGNNSEVVTTKSIALMKGMQQNGVMACAKHFPGHGSTQLDSHNSLPVINKSKIELLKEDLSPFKTLIDSGLTAIMSGHLIAPALDKDLNPASLSKKMLQNLIRDSLHFKGLVISDALNMLQNNDLTSNVCYELKALKAGNDIILFSPNVPLAISKIKEAIIKGEITLQEIDQKVKRILKNKQKFGINKFEQINESNIINDLSIEENKLLQENLFKESIIEVNNEKKLIPIKSNEIVATLTIGNQVNNIYKNKINCASSFYINKSTSNQSLKQIYDSLSRFNTIIIDIHNVNDYNFKEFFINKSIPSFINNLNTQKNIILLVFGNAYCLSHFKEIQSIICTNEDNEITRNEAIEIILGKSKAKGELNIKY